MMSSVDLNTSSANASSATRTNAYNNANTRYSAASNVPPSTYHHSYAGGGGGALPGAETGRIKTELYVVEFLMKVTELVLQSRVHLPADTTRHQASNTRRGWLNLAIEENQHIRDSLGAWRDDVHIPLTLDVYWDGDPGQRVLLERWNIVYTNGLSAAADQFNTFDFHGRRHSSNMGTGNGYSSGGKSRDIVQILKEMLKKMTVLLRALHSFMRLLPAHRFFRQSYPSTLSYEILSCDENELINGFEPDVATSYYSFLPINTPFGFVKVSSLYRRDCSALERRRKRASKEIFQENFIIQDYVPASPEIMPASAPTARQSLASTMQPTPLMMPTPTSPRRMSSPRADNAIDHRRRSSPEMTIDEHGRVGAVRKIQQQHTSQPMAIPHQVKSPASTAFEDRSEAATSALEIPATKPVAIPHHPHSYDDPARLRTIPTNPNVTPAPYGYGNVAVDRSQTPPTGALSTSAGGLSGGGSFQDHPLSSPHHHPLSTPPRHPNSVLTPRMSGRTSFISSVSASGGRRSSNEFTYRASLENFSLDNSSPSHAVTQHAISPSPSNDRAQTFTFGGRRTGSFDSQRSVTPELPSGGLGTSSGGDSRHSSGTSPHLTPPFMAGSPPADRDLAAEADSSSTAALVLRRASLDQSPKLVGGSSPPFQANPSELLSTSPGYSHSKHYETIRRGGTPTIISTDTAFARSGSFHFATGSARSGTASILALAAPGGRSSGNNTTRDGQDRAFSTDIQENTAGIWGISPDSPDKFAISIGASTRRRFMASDEGAANGNANADGSQPGPVYGGSQTDSDMLLLPFALGDDSSGLSSGTTVTVTSSVGERPSLGSESDSQPRTASAAAGVLAWDTASVGSFLQQLKNAPRLQTFETSSERRTSLISNDSQHDMTSFTAATTSSNARNEDPNALVASSFFDDELESFRNLRNELSQTL